MLKQSINSKVVAVFEYLKFSLEGIHIYEGCSIVTVISYQNKKSRQVSGELGKINFFL